MSQFTFNIADYRPLLTERTHKVHDRTHSGLRQNGVVVVAKNADIFERDSSWLEMRPEVVDIQAVRDARRTEGPFVHSGSYRRRGKVLRFTSETSPRIEVLPVNVCDSQSTNDSDPIDFPPAA